MLYDVLMTALYIAVCALCAVIGWIGGSVSPIMVVKEFFDSLEESGDED